MKFLVEENKPRAARPWYAQIMGGHELGPFDRRSAALAAEVDWLIEHRVRAAH